MRLVSAFNVEEDLQRAWREQREEQLQSDVTLLQGGPAKGVEPQTY
ncbi:MAG: hypothetical protein ABSG91_20850 [Syntrophobacteraceae bacterium]|jgi:hypothetical protein